MPTQPDYTGAVRVWRKWKVQWLSRVEWGLARAQGHPWIGFGVFPNPKLAELSDVRIGERMVVQIDALWFGRLWITVAYWRERGDPRWFTRDRAGREQ